MSRKINIAGAVTLALITAGSALAVPTPTRARGADTATLHCTAAKHVRCDVSSPSGVKRVTVVLHGTVGDQKVVDRAFKCLDRVTVDWLPAATASSVDVVPCDPKSPVSSFAAITHGPGDPGSHPGILVAPRGNGTKNTTWGCGPDSSHPFQPCDDDFIAFCTTLGGDWLPEDHLPGEEPSGHCEVPDWPPPPQP